MVKPGPKPDEARARVRRLMDHMSDRTFATYWHTFCVLSELVKDGLISDEQRRAVMAASIRPNGTLNVCKFARISEGLLMEAVARVPEATGPVSTTP